MNKNESKEMDVVDSKLKDLNVLIKKVMGKRTSSSIAKACGVSVSTITRIRNGENKHEITDSLLLDIWENRDKNCDVTQDMLRNANKAVEEAVQKKFDAESKQEQDEMDRFKNQIPDQLLNSGCFVRKLNEEIEIIPGESFWAPTWGAPTAYEIEFKNGERKTLLFILQFYARHTIDRYEKYKLEDPQSTQYFRSYYREILVFQEVRATHSEYENAELIIVWNYEDAFRQNVAALSNLSNKTNVTLALMDPIRGKFKEEVSLDGTEKNLLQPLLKF